MRAKVIGILLDAAGLGTTCMLLATLTSELSSSGRLLALSGLLLLGLGLVAGWAYYQRQSLRSAGDCRYQAMASRMIHTRAPWPQTPQLVERHVFGGQFHKR
jgi:hypothetical protein